MATFKALNLESDSESDIEVDDTKEIQIEEALKLYQAALKYHSDGPVYYELALESYKELFESEIFKYPESQSELRRIELYGPLPEQDELWLEEQDEQPLFEVPTAGENAPSTLPQILHLAHKNYGDFMLEYLQAKLRQPNNATKGVNLREISLAASSALDHFVEALDKDDTDLDLWRRTSSLASLVNSQRIARFCLEAVLDGEDDAFVGIMALPGLAESTAGQQLCELVSQFDDRLSLLQSPLSGLKRKHISRLLKQKLEIYVPIKRYHHEHQAHRPLEDVLSAAEPQRNVLPLPRDWEHLAGMLLQQIRAEQEPAMTGSPLEYAIAFDASLATNDLPREALSSFILHNEKSLSLSLPKPGDFAAQFPGLDRGLPTVPNPAFGDISLLRVKPVKTDSTPTLPMRKRSSDAAAILEGENGRLKSKRIRARESLVDGGVNSETTDPNTTWMYESELKERQSIDEWCFASTDSILHTFGCHELGQLTGFRDRVDELAKDPGLENFLAERTLPDHLPGSDLYAFLTSFPEPLAQALIHANNDINASSDAPQAGLIAALAGNKSAQTQTISYPMLDASTGLSDFSTLVNCAWLQACDVGFKWVELLLKPNVTVLQPQLASQRSSYTGHQWSEALKTLVIQMIVTIDTTIFTSMRSILEGLQASQLRCAMQQDNFKLDHESSQHITMIQTLFELHLDIYCQFKLSKSSLTLQQMSEQEDRTGRWADLSRDAMNLRTSANPSLGLADDLNLRYLWASTFHISVQDNISQDHIIECFKQLRDVFVAVGEPVINLPNNTATPVLSLEAIDREISKLTTSDFFNKMFESNESDPVAVIETLEPLLEQMHQRKGLTPSHDGLSTLLDGHNQNCIGMDLDCGPENTTSSTISDDLAAFLLSGSVAIHLALWQRLRVAYQAIDYVPMVANCYFRAIEILVSELKFSGYAELSRADRQNVLLKNLRQIQDMLSRFLEMTKVREDMLECLDNERLRSIINSLVHLLVVLQPLNTVADEMTVGQRTQPDATRTYQAALHTLQSLQLNSWVTLYLLIKEAHTQNQDLFSHFDENRFEMLRALHRSIGSRGYCDGSNRVLLNLIKKELVGLKHVEGYELEFSQILFDVYGLRCFVNEAWDKLDHQCQRDAFLDRGAALQAVDLLLRQASKIKMADLPKHPIKDTIDKVHGVVARRKPSDVVLRNREIYRSFFKSSISPLNMFNCLRGHGQVNINAVSEAQASLANKGWYFLMGNISLTKFRSQKRTVAGPTEELDIAIAFFMQDLEYGSDKWETWFRLAQAYDSKIEDQITWSAEKLNANMDEIAQQQRSALHCYITATAQATRIEEAGFEMSAKVAELYASFANRVYASSRPPFNMLAFSLQGAERFLSTRYDNSVVRIPLFPQLKEYTAWKFARTLYTRAIAGNPTDWKLHHMLSKCLWKMHTAKEISSLSERRPGQERVISSLIRTIELIPPGSSRDNKKEPTLEPHYRLLATVHKLVMRQTLDPSEACRTLDATRYARKVEKVHDIDEWDSFARSVLKNLQHADKSNWHHRMIVRAAHMIYEESDRDFGAAIGAKHELTQQMFTKTMVLNVWKPEFERAGRHFVYTERYTRFFVRILEQLKDRASLEALARRTRRRPNEYFNHMDLWFDLSTSYLRVLRRYGQVPPGHETAIFSGIDYQDFVKRKEPLERFCQSGDCKSPVLEVLRDAMEFKKINMNLMKPGTIDDLIGDAYAYLYDTVGRQVWAEHLQDEKERKDAEEVKAAEREEQKAIAERNARMNLSHLMNVDGTVDSVSAIAAPANAGEVLAGIKEEAGLNEQAPVKRKIGVGRREIRLCAEACLAKSPSLQNVLEPPDRVQIILPRRSSGVGPYTSTNDDAVESELSDIDEDVVNQGDDEKDGIAIRPMFPNLARRSQDVDEESENADDEGGGEAEEEVEEEDDEDGDDDGDPAGDDTAMDGVDGDREADQAAPAVYRHLASDLDHSNVASDAGGTE